MGGAKELLLLLLKKQKLSRRLLSKTILFTFILNKDSSLQNTHGNVVSISHRLLPFPCVHLPPLIHTQLFSKLSLRASSYYPITSLHFEST